MGQLCSPRGSVTTLGNTTPGHPPYTMSGGLTFSSGSYRVVSDLVLTNGTYTLPSGTIFYVDGQASKTPQRQVTGYTITLGVNASLVLDNATITASGSTTGCPMWRGIVLDNQDANGIGQAPASDRLVIQNNSVISHAWCALDIRDTHIDGTAMGNYTYLIDHSKFSNNLTHIRDVSYHPTGQVSFITNCTFDSNPTQMHYPYEQDPATGNEYYNYEALRLLPLGDDKFNNAVEVRNNTISNAVYGIVNNEFDRAGVLIDGNGLYKIHQTGIWTVNNDTDSGTTTPVTSRNEIAMNGAPTPNTDQIDPLATRYGILGEGGYAPNAFVGNSIAGNLGVGYKQIGLSIAGQMNASGNLVQNVDEGISATELDGSEIVDNRTGGCAKGFVAKRYANGLNQVNRLGCNTFSLGTGVSSTPVGITVEQGATINDIGSFSSPAANRFDGMALSVQNDNINVPVTYYRTNSSQENTTVGGLGSTMINTVTLPTGSLNNYCSSRGASNGNGVNKAKGIAPSAGYLAALMDSVRQQLVPPARYRSYLYEVVSYYANNQQLPTLETWWATLAVPNATAYRTVGRYLLSAYDAQRATIAAQRVLLGLQPQALLNAELAAQLRLRAVVRHLPQTAPRLARADSVTLRALAWSGTSVAEQATRWLRYFHPRIPVPTPAPFAPAVPRMAATLKHVLAKSGVVLSAAYPNPAQTEITITCQLAQADQAAELRFTNLLTGRVVLVVPVAGTGTERSQRVLLTGLPAGQYAYQLVVDGQLAVTPQKLLVNP